MGADDSRRLLDLVRTGEWLPEDLEYHPEFTELLTAAAPRAEQQFGDVIIPPPPVDWPDIYRRTVDLLGRALDLRLAVLFVRASVRVHGWTELAPALNVMRAILEERWASVYPLPDEEDGDDFMRANALSALAGPQTTLADVQAATACGGAGPTVRDLLQAWDMRERQAVSGAWDDVCDELRRMDDSPAAIDALREAHDAAVELARVVQGRLSAPPDLGALLRITRVLTEASAAAADDLCRPPTRPDRAVKATDSPSRADALRELRNVAEWLAAEALTDRVPALRRQARRLQMQTFAKILGDVVPNAGDPLEVAAEFPEER